MTQFFLNTEEEYIEFTKSILFIAQEEDPESPL